ncbi:hypothetical protein P0L94_04010 [Microbacter sp. GSS18]|nr:hypothetical protein P0L94_04010 [Microbacter sp. GSS18]
MRFVWAVAAFVLAAVMIGAGIAQRTVFEGPDTETVAVPAHDATAYLVIDGAVLNALPGAQTLRAQADGEIFAAYGRTSDMTAWLSDATYTSVTLGDEGEMVAATVEPEPEPESEADAEGAADSEESDAEEPAGRNPAGSDLWLDEFTQTDLMIAPLQLPADMSVLIATDGTAPAPSTVTVSWPIPNATPWAGPLIVGGAILMAVGVLLYILGFRHARRARGPRRKGLPLPPTEPIDVATAGEEKGVISASGPTRRSLGSSRRTLVVIPALAVSALLFAGCDADAWPQLAATPTPSPSATVIVPEGQQSPAVTKAQAERILTRIAETVAQADEDRSVGDADTRLEGAMLETRKTNYTLRDAISDYRTPSAILAKPLSIVLPQAYDGWPRSVLAVVDDEETKTSSIMVITQQDPWSPYQLSYQASLEADTPMPDLAPSYIGATQVAPDSPFLILPPDQVATAYADIINNGDESEYAGLFDAETDQFRVKVASDRDRRLEEFNETASQTGQLTFSSEAGSQEPFAIATLESGAIVAVTVEESDRVRPTNDDAVIKLENNPTVETLAGVEQSASGFTTTFLDQLFFYVPGQGSSEKIQLLGYASDILNAKVIQ